MKNRPQVVICMGSHSDLPTMVGAENIIKSFGISTLTTIVSAHRTPHLLQRSVREWERMGVKVIIAGAGGAAHLPGMLASFTICPVIGVPVETTGLEGIDSLLSIVQMPQGVPVATVAINGAYNAGLLAVQILVAGSKNDLKTAKKLKQQKFTLMENVLKNKKQLELLGSRKFLKKILKAKLS